MRIITPAHPYFTSRQSISTPPTKSPHLSSFFRSHSFRSFSQENIPALNIEKKLADLVAQFYPEDSKYPYRGTLLAGVQHMLGTTVDMFKVLKMQGLSEAVVTGKSYSNHVESIKKFEALGFEFVPAAEQSGYGMFNNSMREAAYEVWGTVLQKLKAKEKNGLLIALDDGADLLITTPSKLFNGIAYKPDSVVGIEQTRGGSNRLDFRGIHYPVINVAGSWVKNTIEYPKVAKAVAERISLLVKGNIEPRLKKKPLVGIIGNGSMGSAITKKLNSAGYTVGVFDKSEKRNVTNSQVVAYPDINLLIANTDIIIGCTGQDVTSTPTTLDAFLYARDQKWLISAGSKDVEFKTLLETIQADRKQFSVMPDPLADIDYENRGRGNLSLVRGGFPINFDNKEHSVPPDAIWPTRAALLLACSMSAHLYHTQHPVLKTSKTLKLDVRGQALIYKAYCEINPNDESARAFSHLSASELEDHIAEHSEGDSVEDNVVAHTNIKPHI